MSETYNKNWVSEIKSVDIKSDGIPDSKIGKDKEDKVRLAAISLLDDFKTRSLPAEQFNRLVEEIKEVLRRNDIDKAKLKDNFRNILNHEKNILEYNARLVPLKSSINEINKVIKTKGLTDDILDKMTGGKVDQSLRESLKNIRNSIGEKYLEIKEIIFSENSGLTKKQKEAYKDLLANYAELLRTNSDDPSFLDMLKNQKKNTGEQINSVKKTIEIKLNTDLELFKKASTFNFEAVINIYKTGKQGEFEKFLIENPKERSRLLKGVKDKNGLCPDVGSDKFMTLIGKLQQIEFNEKRKQLEQKLKKRLGDEYGKQLLEKIDNELKDNFCTFDLIKVISDFNKTLDGKKIRKLSLHEIKFYAGEAIYNENSKIIFELNSFLYKNDLTINDIDGKSEKEIRNILGNRKININDQNEIINLYFKYKNGNIAEKNFSFLSTPDIKTIIDGKEKGKSNNDIAGDIGKGNPAFKQFNSNYNFSSSVISVPTSNRSEFFGEIFKNIDSGKGGNENLTFSNGFNVNISKNGNGYIINYGDKKEICSSKEEVINVINMGEYIQKLGLGFLFGGINRVIYRIKEKGNGKINEKDGLSNDEMKLGLKSIGEALIPDFDSTKTEIKDLEEQFTNKDIFNDKIKKTKTDKSNKFSDKLKDNIGNISSLEQLARILYPSNSKGKDFSIDSFINNL